MATASLATREGSTGHVVARSASDRPSGRQFFPAIMEAARSLWRSKVAEELAVIMGCDVRSAERYLAGARTPEGELAARLLFSEVGPMIIAAGVEQLPPHRREKFWKEIGKAARRAELLAERDRLQAEIDATE